MNRRQLPDDTPTDSPTEKSLIRLHRQVYIIANICYNIMIHLHFYILLLFLF